MYGSDSVPRVKFIKSILNNVGRSIILHSKILREQWAENELDELTKTLMHSDEIYNVSIFISVVNWHRLAHCQLTYVHPIVALSTDKCCLRRWLMPLVCLVNCQWVNIYLCCQLTLCPDMSIDICSLHRNLSSSHLSFVNWQLFNC